MTSKRYPRVRVPSEVALTEAVGADRALPGRYGADQLRHPFGIGLLTNPMANDRRDGRTDPLADGGTCGPEVSKGLGANRDTEARRTPAGEETLKRRGLKRAELINRDKGANPLPHHRARCGSEVEQHHLSDRAADISGSIGVEAKVGDLTLRDRPPQVKDRRARPIGIKPGLSELGGGEVLQPRAQTRDGTELIATQCGDRAATSATTSGSATRMATLESSSGLQQRATAARVNVWAAAREHPEDEAQERRGRLAVEVGIGRAPALDRDQPLGALIDGAVGERVIATRALRCEEVEGNLARERRPLGGRLEGSVGLCLQDHRPESRADHVVDDQRRQRGGLAGPGGTGNQ